MTALLRLLLIFWLPSRPRIFGASESSASGSGNTGAPSLAEPLVEAPRDLARQLEVRKLIPANGHDVALAEQDVGGLVDRICVHGRVDGGEARRVDLFLDGRVAIELAHADQGEKRHEQLIERRDMAVAEDVRVPAIGVESGRQIVEDQLGDVLRDAVDRVAIGQHLVVGDDDERLEAELLQLHPVLERAEVVADVQRPGRAIARQHAVSPWVLDEIGAQRVRAADGLLERAAGATLVISLIEEILALVGTARTALTIISVHVCP